MPEYLLPKADSIMDDATATVPTVRLTTATDTADGITGMTMYTAVNSVVIKAVAVWTKEMCYVWTKEKGSRTYI